MINVTSNCENLITQNLNKHARNKEKKEKTDLNVDWECISYSHPSEDKQNQSESTIFMKKRRWINGAEITQSIQKTTNENENQFGADQNRMWIC